jgi:hypothetical protein
VSLDGKAVCGKCGERGQVLHHLGLIFWTCLSRRQLSAVVRQMQPVNTLRGCTGGCGCGRPMAASASHGKGTVYGSRK